MKWVFFLNYIFEIFPLFLLGVVLVVKSHFNFEEVWIYTLLPNYHLSNICEIFFNTGDLASTFYENLWLQTLVFIFPNKEMILFTCPNSLWKCYEVINSLFDYLFRIISIYIRWFEFLYDYSILAAFIMSRHDDLSVFKLNHVICQTVCMLFKLGSCNRL